MSNTTCDDPRTYPLLAQLLDTPTTLDFSDHPTMLASFRRAVEAALQVPPGAARQALLSTLNGAISDACCRRKYYRDKQVLVQQLRASYPCASEIRDTTLSIQSMLQTIHETAEQAQNREAKRGVNPNQTSWPAFRQELTRLTGIIACRIQTLDRSADASLTPEKMDGSHIAYSLQTKEAYQ